MQHIVTNLYERKQMNGVKKMTDYRTKGMTGKEAIRLTEVGSENERDNRTENAVEIGVENRTENRVDNTTERKAENTTTNGAKHQLGKWGRGE